MNYYKKFFYILTLTFGILTFVVPDESTQTMLDVLDGLYIALSSVDLYLLGYFQLTATAQLNRNFRLQKTTRRMMNLQLYLELSWIILNSLEMEGV